MKSLKEIIHNFGRTIKRVASPTVSYVDSRCRLKSRTRALNILARRHPKRFFAISIGVIAMVFLSDLAMTIFAVRHPSTTNEFTEALNQVHMVNATFDGLSRLNDRNIAVKESYGKAAAAGVTLGREIDSLMSLPVKTKEDSIAIAEKYRQLKKITQTLNISSNEED